MPHAALPRSLVATMALAFGAAAPAETHGTAGASQLDAGIVVQDLSVPPPASDAASEIRAAWNPLAAPFVRGARFVGACGADHALVIDRDGILWRHRRTGEWVRIAAGVEIAPIADAQCETVVHAVGEAGGAVTVRVWSATGSRTVLEGRTVGALLAMDDATGTLLFVGPGPGGVAGLHAASLEEGRVRCLTQCDLRIGDPWADRLSPLPTTAEEIARGLRDAVVGLRDDRVPAPRSEAP